MISAEQAETIDELGAAVSAALLTTFLFVLIAFMGGRLLVTWIFLNSLQLIVYAPLVSTSMPSNLHYFLTNYLQLFRLNFVGVEAFEMGYIEGEDVFIRRDEVDYLSPLLM